MRGIASKNIKENIRYIVGIDEAGRGPIAGPLAVGGVMVRVRPLRPNYSRLGHLPLAGEEGTLDFFTNIRDSKKLLPKKREEWFKKLQAEKKRGMMSYAVAFISHSIIDRKGMSFALRVGVARVLAKLGTRPKQSLVLLDGSLHAPDEFLFQQTIIKGDEKIPIISLASIAAKVSRDRSMIRMAKKYPKYNFEKHKGYGTREHYKKIARHGVSDIHRKSFLSLANNPSSLQTKTHLVE